MYIYLDESGDLGFRHGSTRYFTIAFVIVEQPFDFIRSVKDVKVKYNIPRRVEIKGSTTRRDIKVDFLERIRQLEIEVHAITVRKQNVETRLRSDTNILYNYVVGLLLVDCILQKQLTAKVFVNVDRRVISITSGFKFNEYLRYKIWYENKRPDIDLQIKHADSHKSYAIQGIDVICNSIFRKYNSDDSSFFNVIADKVKCDKRLFF